MSTTDEFANAVEAGSGGGESWKPENVGDVVFGTYRAMKTNVGKHNSNVYVIQEDGKDETTSVWGSTVIDGRFEEIPVGSRVKIEYLGEVSGKSAKYKDYKIVYVKQEVPANVANTFPGAEVA